MVQVALRGPLGSASDGRGSTRRGAPPAQREGRAEQPEGRAAVGRARPLVRLRAVLGWMALGGAVWWGYPRAAAAVDLHSTATTFADYALCMVGPTGPTLLRDNPAEFRRLLARRVVAALPDERPFFACAPAARVLTGDEAVAAAHQAVAWDFDEYGAYRKGAAPAPSRALSVANLEVTTRRLAELAERAAPFSRGGYTRLVERSVNAHEAPHPVALASPSLGSGLPAWRAPYRVTWREGQSWFAAFGAGAHLSIHASTDGGLTWAPSDSRRAGADARAGRCTAAERSYALELDADGEGTLLASYGADGSRMVAPVTAGDRAAFALVCDEATAWVGTKSATDDSLRLSRCGFHDDCTELKPPAFWAGGPLPRFPADIARVKGTTVLAVNMGGVVRVTSTRDDGRRWTPYTVAFDAAQHPGFRAHIPLPRRLLVLGERTFLYGGAPRAAQTYPVLVSEDQGATWRSPEL